MFKFFKKQKEVDITEQTDEWNSDNVKVYYKGEVLSPDYARYTLLFPNDGTNIRKDFNDQPKESYHLLCPDGYGQIIYTDVKGNSDGSDRILEQYEGEFDSGQYHGVGKLVDRHGEILQGEFKHNKFIGNKNNEA